MAVVECVSSQGSESNNGWCLVTMPSSVVLSEVIGVTSGTCSWTPSGGRLHPPLESAVTAVVCLATCRPCKKHLISLSPHRSCCTGCRLLLVAGSWEVTVIRHVWGPAWSIWQWQHQGGCVPKGARAAMGGAQFPWPLFFANLSNNWGCRWSLFTDPSVVAGYIPLWFLRCTVLC